MTLANLELDLQREGIRVLDVTKDEDPRATGNFKATCKKEDKLFEAWGDSHENALLAALTVSKSL